VKRASWLLAFHLAALSFGLAGILIALPHPELWAGYPALVNVYTFGIQHGGATHILLGAATMVILGGYSLGWYRTITFALVGTVIPLCAELLGTSTGWPFGGYAYTDYLGAKIAGRVPYSVPLSWFYMGFAAYLLALAIVGSTRESHRPWLAVLLGAWLLTAWDLVLDPAMASTQFFDHTGLQFWTWQEHGAYFGMPPRNLVGWFGTGVVFMAAGRLLWRGAPARRPLPVWIPLILYLANIAWAMALALSVGLWQTALFAVPLGIFPALLAVKSQAREHSRRRWTPTLHLADA
jgi:putative membrane protein